MADYPIPTQLVVDERLVPAANAQVTVYDLNDTANTTPLALKDMNGNPLQNPITTTANALSPGLIAPVPKVKFVAPSNGLSIPITSTDGLEAAAQAAADNANAAKQFVAGIGVAATITGAPGSSAAVAMDETGQMTFTVPQGAKGDQGLPGPNAVPADTAVAGYVNDNAAQTRAALDGRYASKGLVLNAKDYGVKGDGATDDTAAIQALLNGITPNTTVHFPAGTYLHDHLVFSGKSNFALVGDGAVFVAATRTDRYIRFVNCTDFTVRGIVSKGATATTRQGPTRGLSIEGCQRAKLIGNRATNTEGVGIYVGKDGGAAASSDVELANNQVSDTCADGIHITGGSLRVTVSGNQIVRSGDDSIAVVSYNTDAAACEDVTVTGNLAVNSGSRGLAVVGGRGVTLSGNVVNAPKNAGIYVAYEATYGIRSTKNVSITGNTIRAANTYNNPTTTFAAIHVVGDGGTTNPVEGITITGNTIDGSAYHGILAGSTNPGCYGFVIANNNIRNTGNGALMVQAVTNVSVVGNMLDTSNEGGLILSGTRGVAAVIGNIVKDPNRTSTATSKRAIWMGSPNLTKGIVAGNLVYDSTNASNQPFDLSTSANILVYGNEQGGNFTNYPATGRPFIAPGNVLLNGAFETSGLGGGQGVTGIRNAVTVPTANASSGGILYAEGGALKWRGSSGTITTIAPA